jgi:aminoglycoside phosphotransferase (APT) family kinase protein
MTGPAWNEVVAGIGYADAELIGQGMESVVVRLGDGLVGKVWTHRTAGELLPIQAFYAELAAQGLPFATPEMVEIRSRDGVAVSLEKEISGTSVRTAVRNGQVSIAAAQEATVLVTDALRLTEAGPATRALAVLDEAYPLWADQPSWGHALAGLVERRARRFRGALLAALPDLDRVVEQIQSELVAVPSAGPAGPGSGQIVHGDICPENILVDDAGRPTALLDWGFLTTAGDHTFDAATAAGFFDMYGPDAAVHDEALVERFEALGHARERMLLYRAAYGIATANAYSADGQDGHFAWCVRNVEAFGRRRSRS